MVDRLKCLQALVVLGTALQFPEAGAVVEQMLASPMTEVMTDVISQPVSCPECFGWGEMASAYATQQSLDDISQGRVLLSPGYSFDVQMSSQVKGFTYFLAPGVYDLENTLSFKPGIRIIGVQKNREPWLPETPDIQRVSELKSYGSASLSGSEGQYMVVVASHQEDIDLAKTPVIKVTGEMLESFFRMAESNALQNIVLDGSELEMTSSGCHSLIQIEGDRLPQLSRVYFKGVWPCQEIHAQGAVSQVTQASAELHEKNTFLLSEMTRLMWALVASLSRVVESSESKQGEDECDGPCNPVNGTGEDSVDGHSNSATPTPQNYVVYELQQRFLNHQGDFHQFLFNVQVILEWLENMDGGRNYSFFLHHLGINQRIDVGRRGLYWAIAYQMMSNGNFFRQFFKALQESEIAPGLPMLAEHLNRQNEVSGRFRSMLRGIREIQSPPTHIISQYRKKHDSTFKKMFGITTDEDEMIPLKIRRKLVNMYKTKGINPLLARRLNAVMMGRLEDVVDLINALEPYASNHESVEQFAYILSQAQHAVARSRKMSLVNHVSFHHLPYHSDPRLAMAFVITTYYALLGDMNALALAFQYLLNPAQIGQLAAPPDRMFGQIAVRQQGYITSELLEMAPNLYQAPNSIPVTGFHPNPNAHTYNVPKPGSQFWPATASPSPSLSDLSSRRYSEINSRPPRHSTMSTASSTRNSGMNSARSSILSGDDVSVRSLNVDPISSAVRSGSFSFVNPDGLRYADRRPRTSTMSSTVSDRSVLLPVPADDQEEYVEMQSQVQTPPPLPPRLPRKKKEPVEIYDLPPVEPPVIYDEPPAPEKEKDVQPEPYYDQPPKL